ncbi:hypothetical protein GCM10009613_08210 [Pseudonocardia kongjuensis]|uniref:Uncharacterized protein n=1 Tax=Pseudonocardia kongjuensis TaxID=102227 RepID=A0ABP4I9M7_9PSEU
MSRFRLFGRSEPVDDGPDPWLDDPPPVPGPPPSTRPATAAARPALWTPRRPAQDPPADPEPVTDPFGFPALRARGAAETGTEGAGWGPPVSPAADPPAVFTAPARSTADGPAPAPGTAPPDPDAGPATGPDIETRRAPTAAPPVGAGTDPGTRHPPTTAPADTLTSGTGALPPPETTPTGPDPTPGPPPTTPRTDDPTPGTEALRPPETTPGPPPTTPPPDGANPVPPPATTPDDADHSDPVDPAAAAALAGAFAADLLSWDENDPDRRGRALGAHLSSPVGAALLGWTGTGRQRADLVLPGRVRREGERVLVEVRVRVVPYRRVDARTPGAPEPEPERPLGEPAAAPAPSARGWRGLAARWVRIEVTVARDGDRLVVDAGPEPGQRTPSPHDLAGRPR